ncbi:hypothetical protein GRX03_12330 [Halovenus sp. WSH3]|uniref:Uncharacterized protein n=1 Tax=Halovenus carboxidivorans TaxID=2692199 RepID=A0A6B0T640_9EURY|nr:hypothetical protein [Halovenus carboxidivorans]MXR52387.1 hypothetical protein [Halovenus carboxidivorans]
MSGVEVKYIVNDPVHQSQLAGSIRIDIGQITITDIDFESSEKQGFIGFYIHRDLYFLLNVCLDIKKGKLDVYEETSSEIESTILKIIHEPLNRSHIRVALRQWGKTDYDDDLPSPETATGCPVLIDEYCEEVYTTVERFLEECEEKGLDTDESLLKSIRDDCNELKQLVHEGNGVLG